MIQCIVPVPTYDDCVVFLEIRVNELFEVLYKRLARVYCLALVIIQVEALLMPCCLSYGICGLLTYLVNRDNKEGSCILSSVLSIAPSSYRVAATSIGGESSCDWALVENSSASHESIVLSRQRLAGVHLEVEAPSWLNLIV